jgi:hypothetical protein
MKHIKPYNESAGPLFRELKWEELENKTNGFRMTFLSNSDTYTPVAIRRWITSINKEDSMFKCDGLAMCNIKGVLDPCSPRHAESFVNLITRSYDLTVDSFIGRPYNINVHQDDSRDSYLVLQVKDRYDIPFTLRDLPDIEVGGITLEDRTDRLVWVYFLNDDYVVVKVHQKSAIRFLWCDGVDGVLEGLATVLPTTT